MDSTLVSLLERLRNPGEQAAWERFVQLYTPLLCFWARRLGLEEPDVSDLVQDVFEILVRKLPEFSYDPRQRFRAWLWTITRNKFMEQRRRKVVPVQNAPDGLDDIAADNADDGFEETEYRQYLVDRVVALIRPEFQPQTWDAFWLTTSTDRPAADVAAELGMSVEAVYTAKSRVLRRIRQELKGLLE